MELLEGKIRMYINFDSKTAITEAKSPRLDDGEWHEISVQQHGKNGSLTVDTFNTELVIPGKYSSIYIFGSHKKFLRGRFIGKHSEQFLMAPLFFRIGRKKRMYFGQKVACPRTT